MLPETRYTKSGGVNIAYQTFGEGEHDLVVVSGWFTNVESTWDVTRAANFYRELASFARVILFDKRGTGMSDRDGQAYVLEDRMDDVRAVMDAARVERGILCGISEGGPMSILFAATYPERTAALVLIGSYARKLAAPDYPWGVDPETYRRFVEEFETDWTQATRIDSGGRAPSVATDTLFKRQWAKYVRQAASPGTAARYARMNGEIDVRPVLRSVRAPTLVLHASGDRAVNVGNGKYLARTIENAEFTVLDSDDHIAFWTDQRDRTVAEIRRFVTGERRTVNADRQLLTVLFTDIVHSTQLAATMGDQRWNELLQQHHAAVRELLGAFRGREVKTTGDGFHAVFDGPARAVQCAGAIQAAVRALGIEVRAGLHCGECVVTEDDVEGIAVHLAARVAAEAAPGAVVVSQTVRDLVVGSGLTFSDLGEHRFKGVPETWSLYEVTL